MFPLGDQDGNELIVKGTETHDENGVRRAPLIELRFMQPGEPEKLLWSSQRRPYRTVKWTTKAHVVFAADALRAAADELIAAYEASVDVAETLPRCAACEHCVNPKKKPKPTGCRIGTLELQFFPNGESCPCFTPGTAGKSP
jgi:hypothetical protein